MADKIPSYSDAELLELLDNIESDRVERKRSFKNDAEKARQAVCAFANDLSVEMSSIFCIDFQ